MAHQTNVTNSSNISCENMKVQGHTVYVNSTINVGSSSSNPLPTKVAKKNETELANHLQSLYKDRICLTSILPWCPDQTWETDQVYTTLIVEHVKGYQKNNAIPLEHIFSISQVKETGLRIILEGNAGYGKTTLALKLVSDWSLGKEYIRYFKLCFFLRLRDVQNTLWGGLLDTLLDPDSVQLSEVDLNNEEVLLVLDGYDEASDKTKQEVDKLLKGFKWSKCHVVLTSRPGHVPDDVLRQISRLLVKGFGKVEVVLAVSKYFINSGILTKPQIVQAVSVIEEEYSQQLAILLSDKVNPYAAYGSEQYGDSDLTPITPDLFRKFVNNLLVKDPYRALSECPLTCGMLCCLFDDKHGQLPATRTDLYFEMVNINMYRTARKQKPKLKRNLKTLHRKFPKDCDHLLQNFGRSCLLRFMTKDNLSFSMFDLTTEESNDHEDAEEDSEVIINLLSAGVVVKDFELSLKGKSSSQPYYQVPHRTVAEFLAAYYLVKETDEKVVDHYVTDLFMRAASFRDILEFIVEIEGLEIVTRAFQVIKFPLDFLQTWEFMRNYLEKHGNASLSQLRQVLPDSIEISYDKNTDQVNHVDEPLQSEVALPYYPFLSCLAIAESRLYLPTPSQNSIPTVLQLAKFASEVLVYTVDSNAYLTSQGTLPPCLELLTPSEMQTTPNLTEVLLAVLNSPVTLSGLIINDIDTDKSDEEAQYVNMLLKSQNCPAHLKTSIFNSGIHSAWINALRDSPAECRLKSFDYFCGSFDLKALDELVQVLICKWIYKLEHLGLTLPVGNKFSFPGISSILRSLSTPGNLTSLHLCLCFPLTNGDLGDFVIGVMNSRLEVLELKFMELILSSEGLEKILAYLKENNPQCKLKCFRLVEYVNLHCSFLPCDTLPGDWRCDLSTLEELYIRVCVCSSVLFDWFRSSFSFSNLRVLTIDDFLVEKPSRERDDRACSLVDFLTQTCGATLEALTLPSENWYDYDKTLLHPSLESLKRCSELKKIGLMVELKLRNSSVLPLDVTTMIYFPKPNIYPISIVLVELLNCMQLSELTLPNGYEFLSNLTMSFWHCVAENADKWPGNLRETKSGIRKSSLTIRYCNNEVAAVALSVFRERKLRFEMKYVSNRIYEIWFPAV